MGLHRECMELVTANFFLFFSFFLGERVLEHPVFLNNISNYFPDTSKKISIFTVLLQGGALFFFEIVFLGGCQLVTFYNLLIFPFVMYFFSCSLVTCHLIFPCGVHYFW